MKTKTKAIIAAGAGVVLGSFALTATTQADGRWESYGHRGDHHGEHHEYGRGAHHREGRGYQSMLEAYDSNKDGKLNQAEVDEARANRLSRFDSNGDGKLTLDEYQALWLDAMREHMVDRFQNLDRDGDAVVTVEEFGDPYSQIVQRRDRNGDGEISDDDFRFRRYQERPDDD